MKHLYIENIILILIISLVSSIENHIRFTTNGHQCIFPFTENNMTYTNCAIDPETNKEWCYIDSFQIIKHECARGNFKISSPLLIKSLKYCLYLDTVSQKLQSKACHDLINKNEKNYSFKFYWFNHGQIKIEGENNCLTAVDMPIIKNEQLKYYGYIKKAKCDLYTEASDNLLLQKWTMEENGMIINEKNKKCLIRENDNLIYLGDCIGNIKGYEGREFFILEKFNIYMKELYALEKIISVYNEEKIILQKINSHYERDMSEIININTQMINYKDKLDDLERNINNEIQKVTKEDVALSSKNKFGAYGVKIKMFKRKDYGNRKEVIFGKDISIIRGKITKLNIFDLFEKKTTEIKNNYNYDISDFDMIEYKGMYLINNDITQQKGKFKIETNMNFVFVFNNKVLLNSVTTYSKTEPLTFLTQTFSLSKNALYPIKIFLSDISSTSTFHIYFIPSSSSDLLSSLTYIPMTPNIKAYLPLPKEIVSYLQPLDCDKNFNSINTDTYSLYKFVCKGICKENHESICYKAYTKGYISMRGGIIGLRQNSVSEVEIIKNDFNMAGVYEMITNVKLGYYDDYNKNSEYAKEKIFKDYTIKMNLNKERVNKGDSFVMYKKSIIMEKEQEVVIDVGLHCDSTSNSGRREDNIEVVHDVSNEFSLLVNKISFRDFIEKDITEQQYVKDISVKILSSTDDETDFLNDKSNKNSNIKICRNTSGNTIILSVVYHTKSYNDNIIDNEEKIHCQGNYQNEECNRLFNEGYLPYQGGVIIRNHDNKEQYDYFSELPMIINYNNNYKVYLNSKEKELNEMISKYKTEMLFILSKRAPMSSFLEMEASSSLYTEKSNKIYSKNFLSKIEGAIESISNKLLTNNNFIKQIKNNNKIIAEKLNKLSQNSTNSLNVIFAQMNQIERMQQYLDKQITIKLLSYDSLINDTLSKENLTINTIHNHFGIIDSYYSTSHSSLWDISPTPDSFMINTVIKSYTKLISSFTISFLTWSISKIKVQYTFTATTKGNFAFVFRFNNVENYDMIFLSNNNNKDHLAVGEIKYIRVIDNEYNIIDDISCDKMIEVFGACLGYSYNKENNIQFTCDNNKNCKFDINNRELLRFSLDVDDSYIGFGFNNFDSVVNVNNIHISNHYNEEIKPIEIKKAAPRENELNIKVKKYFNQITNSFDTKTELQMEKRTNLIENIPTIEVDSIIKKCYQISPSESICNYISTLIKENDLNIASPSTNIDKISNLILTSCLKKMEKNKEVCEQINKRVLPVVKKLKHIFEIPIRTIDNIAPIKNNNPIHSIHNLIYKCGFDFLPKLLKNKKICLNQMMIREISKRKKDSDCLIEYCYNCCQDNYSNEQCETYCDNKTN